MTVSLPRQALRRARLAAASLWILLAAAACSTLPADAGRPPSWEARQASARVDLARSQALAGDAATARNTAAEALNEARRAGWPVGIARAEALLGWLHGDPQRVAAAVELLERHGARDRVGLPAADLAELAAAAGDLPAAELWIARARAALPDAPTERGARAAGEARLHHLHAEVLRATGHADAALARQRQALLSLSLLSEHELIPLRQAAHQRLGDDLVGRREPRAAFEHHAQAALLARRLSDPAAESLAELALAGNLIALARHRDARLHCERGLRLAAAVPVEARDPETVPRALRLLERLGDDATATTWAPLLAALADGAARVPAGAPLSSPP